MHFNPLLMAAWTVLAASFFALLIYRGQLTRYEDEQLFLNEDVQSREQQNKTQLVRQLRQVEPVLRLVGGAAGLVTVCVVSMYVWNAWQTLQ